VNKDLLELRVYKDLRGIKVYLVFRVYQEIKVFQINLSVVSICGSKISSISIYVILLIK
jgi:hypothetical protein